MDWAMRSYHTCGSIDKFSNVSIQETIAGRQFTAVIPSTPYAPFTYPKGYVQACLPLRSVNIVNVSALALVAEHGGRQRI